MYVCIVARSASKAHGGMLGEDRPCNLFHYAGTLSPAVEGQHRGSLTLSLTINMTDPLEGGPVN
jgi:hypothetical protein